MPFTCGASLDCVNCALGGGAQLGMRDLGTGKTIWVGRLLKENDGVLRLSKRGVGWAALPSRCYLAAAAICCFRMWFGVGPWWLGSATSIPNSPISCWIPM